MVSRAAAAGHRDRVHRPRARPPGRFRPCMAGRRCRSRDRSDLRRGLALERARGKRTPGPHRRARTANTVIQKEDPMIRTSVGALLAITFMTAGSHGQSRPATLPDSEIQKILAERIDVSHQGVGIVVGVIDANGRRGIAHGRARAADPRPLDSDTIFEIGSGTKVCTALLLADMVQRGEVALDDPISKYLPSGVKAPERNGRAIALVDLATHTSGLPRVPANLRPATFQDPYADYTAEHLDAFLSSYELPREPGTKFEYSNLGGGLLGYLLARRAGMDYAALVRARITGPLGMTSTTAARPGDEDGPRLAAGHNAPLQPGPPGHLHVLPGWGGGGLEPEGHR